jgi:hypothetical protein
LDEERPLIVLQPSAPLKHNCQYAVAVVDAVDGEGRKIQVSPYLRSLLNYTEDAGTTLSERDRKRGTFMKEKSLPALHSGAPWLGEHGELHSIQMLFDFNTISAESQLGVTRKAINETLKDIEVGNWVINENVRVVKVVNGTCERKIVGKILHVDIDVPNFLLDSHQRESKIDMESREGVTTVKFLVVVPCSVMPSSQGLKTVRAIVDYGHGFLYSRRELLESDFALRYSERKYISYLPWYRKVISYTPIICIQNG